MSSGIDYKKEMGIGCSSQAEYDKEYEAITIFLKQALKTTTKNTYFMYPVTYYCQVDRSKSDEEKSLVIQQLIKEQQELKTSIQEGKEKLQLCQQKEETTVEEELVYMYDVISDEVSYENLSKKNYLGYVQLTNPKKIKKLLCLPGYRYKIKEKRLPKIYEVGCFVGAVQCYQSGKIFPDVEVYDFLCEKKRIKPIFHSKLMNEVKRTIALIEKKLCEKSGIPDYRIRGLSLKRVHYRQERLQYPTLYWVGDCNFSGYPDTLYYWEFNKKRKGFHLRKKILTKTKIFKVLEIITVLHELRNYLSMFGESALDVTALKHMSHEFIISIQTKVRLAKSLVVKRRWG